MSDRTQSRLLFAVLFLLLGADLIARVGVPTAHAEGPKVHCDTAEVKGFAPKKTLEEMKTTISGVVGSGNGGALVVPLTSQGTYVGSVVCAW